MSTRTCKVGVHGRNEPHEFREQDFEVIREARIEVVKMLSHTRAEDFERLKRDNPGIEIITRLRDDRIGAGHHPSPAEFADKMTPLMGRLQPYCVKFQISEVLKLDLPAAVAVLAAAAERPATHRGGRLTIRFEVDALARAWGDAGRATFAEHFRFDAACPWQDHQYRTVGDDWRPVHDGQEDEWAAFRLARRVAGEAAYPAVGMGLAGMMGFNHALLGYDSAGQMFDAFASSERYQVMGLFDFIGGRDADAPPLRALRHNDLQAFAALFWGPAAAAHYAAWLARAVAAFERLGSV